MVTFGACLALGLRSHKHVQMELKVWKHCQTRKYSPHGIVKVYMAFHLEVICNLLLEDPAKWY